jgi:hypothetical protein
MLTLVFAKILSSFGAGTFEFWRAWLENFFVLRFSPRPSALLCISAFTFFTGIHPPARLVAEVGREGAAKKVIAAPSHRCDIQKMREELSPDLRGPVF